MLTKEQIQKSVDGARLNLTVLGCVAEATWGVLEETSVVQTGEGLLSSQVEKLRAYTGGVSAMMENSLDNLSRKRRQRKRETIAGWQARRESALAALDTTPANIAARDYFQAMPLQHFLEMAGLPNEQEIVLLQRGFNEKAKRGNRGPYVPWEEKRLGVIPFDPDDRRIKGLKREVGIEIRSTPLTHVDDSQYMLYDWVRPEREDGQGRRLTGPAVLDRVQNPDGSFSPPAEYRVIEIPNIHGAYARRGLRCAMILLGEDYLNDPRIRAIVRRLDDQVETTGKYIEPRKVTDIVSFAKARPDLPNYSVVKEWQKRFEPPIDPGTPPILKAKPKGWSPGITAIKKGIDRIRRPKGTEVKRYRAKRP